MEDFVNIRFGSEVCNIYIRNWEEFVSPFASPFEKQCQFETIDYAVRSLPLGSDVCLPKRIVEMIDKAFKEKHGRLPSQ